MVWTIKIQATAHFCLHFYPVKKKRKWEGSGVCVWERVEKLTWACVLLAAAWLSKKDRSIGGTLPPTAEVWVWGLLTCEGTNTIIYTQWKHTPQHNTPGGMRSQENHQQWHGVGKRSHCDRHEVLSCMFRFHNERTKTAYSFLSIYSYIPVQQVRCCFSLML